MNYPPNAPPPGGYGGPPGGPPPGGYGAPPGGGGYGAPPPGYGAPPPPGMPGMGGPMGGAMAPHAPYGIDPVSGMPFSDKSKMVAGLLQIFVGTFGVGRFYTGHTGIAIAQIAVSWLTCGIGAIWPLIDGVMMLMGKVPDAQGRPLRD
ncbi:MAG: TM2 domain-containing protein [Labilithrix sp.]|nr:TM2 domain-containing protein [Labilithrix sp.]MBX3214683.1 TM2 domain-containing protein [Labilithrix sp.]